MDREALKQSIVELIGEHSTSVIAQAVGVDPAMVTRWRKADGTHVPEVHHINRLIAACGHDPSDEMGCRVWRAFGAPVGP